MPSQTAVCSLCEALFELPKIQNHSEKVYCFECFITDPDDAYRLGIDIAQKGINMKIGRKRCHRRVKNYFYSGYFAIKNSTLSNTTFSSNS